MAKPLTIEEVRELMPHQAVYLEYRLGKSTKLICTVIRVTKVVTDGKESMTFEGFGRYHRWYYNEYGTHWRLWLDAPSEEEQEEAEWIGTV